MKKILISIFLIIAIIPAMASEGTKFTVFGQVSDVGGSPINGADVVLSVSGGSISTITANVTSINGNNASGYYVLELANLPVSVNTGDPMTVTATITGKSASWSGPRAAAEPQEINLQLAIVSSGGTPPGSGGGSSGSGGGGGSSGENYSNIIARESRDEMVAKDLPAKYIFTTASSPVYEIEIISNINAGLIESQIEILKNTSTLINESAPGTVYKYLNIWVGNIGFATPRNIKDATIKFKVETSWIESGNFKDTDMVMMRWDGTKWVRLETQVKNRNSTFTFLESKTFAFSHFVITAIKTEEAATVSSAVTATTPVKPVDTETVTSTPFPTKKAAGFEFVLAIAAIIVLYTIRRTGR